MTPTSPDLETDVPQQRHQLLDRGAAGAIGRSRCQQQDVNVGGRVQFAAPVAADGDQRPFAQPAAVQPPRFAQHRIDECGTRMHQLFDRFFGVETLAQLFMRLPKQDTPGRRRRIGAELLRQLGEQGPQERAVGAGRERFFEQLGVSSSHG
jgi:hypothetical protein